MGLIRIGVVPVIGFFAVVAVLLQSCNFASANVVFRVQHKYAGNKRSLNEVKSHDSNRHRRFLSAADLPLSGDGSPTSVALYYTKIQIGTPAKDYFVQVDTGSDLLWVNCIDCEKCPKTSDLGVPLSLYDPKSSSGSKKVPCDDEFCTSTYEAPNTSECKVGMLCAYSIEYGDGSSTSGYFVNDDVQLAQVVGDGVTATMSGKVTFGCGANQSGQLGSAQQALDGIMGFGKSNASVLAQLALAKKVKKTFSHCLNANKGGGFFAIGEVVEPKVKLAPLITGQKHYNVALNSIDVNGNALKLPTSILDTLKTQGAIADSGTTLAYFPDVVYSQLMEKIMAAQPNSKPYTVEKDFQCFKYTGNIDEGFPTITFHFQNSLSLEVSPHQYFFEMEKGEWCVGFLNSKNQGEAGKDLTLMGDLLLSDKLVTYDMENKAIGWIDYDCSTSIKVKDETSGKVYEVIAN